jgi:hypothetical protein
MYNSSEEGVSNLGSSLDFKVSSLVLWSLPQISMHPILNFAKTS